MKSKVAVESGKGRKGKGMFQEGEKEKRQKERCREGEERFCSFKKEMKSNGRG